MFTKLSFSIDLFTGVMDAAVTTDFRMSWIDLACSSDLFILADIKFKCLIHSKDAGSIMLIPREVFLEEQH